MQIYLHSLFLHSYKHYSAVLLRIRVNDSIFKYTLFCHRKKRLSQIEKQQAFVQIQQQQSHHQQQAIFSSESTYVQHTMINNKTNQGSIHLDFFLSVSSTYKRILFLNS